MIERFWESEARWRRPVLAIGVAVLAAQWIRILMNPVGDFRNHWIWGARFVEGEFLYAGGANIPYLPFWAMVFAPFSLLPVHVAQALVYPAGVLSVGLLLAILHARTRDALPLEPGRVFWVGVAAIVLSSRYLLRDLSEAGPNTILLALIWTGIWLWSRDRPLKAGLLVGSAVALKLAAVVFVLYFALRREWRFALASIVAALVLTLIPIVWQGAALYGRHVTT